MEELRKNIQNYTIIGENGFNYKNVLCFENIRVILSIKLGESS